MKRLILMTGVIAVVLSAATILHAEEITVRGKLQKTVEAGGWLVVERDAKVSNSELKRLYQKHAWFKEGTNVEAVGETKDVMTTFMEGTPFEAKSIKPITIKQLLLPEAIIAALRASWSLVIRSFKPNQTRQS